MRNNPKVAALIKDHLGALVLDLLEDPKTADVMLNPDGRVWVERLGEPMICVGEMNAAKAELFIRNAASALDREVHWHASALTCRLPFSNLRLAASVPPLTPTPTFVIRKHGSALRPLAEYVEAGLISKSHESVLRDAIAEKLNILVSGGTGSGKTTFLNALIALAVEANPSERFVVIEDDPEIQCNAAQVVAMATTPEVNITDALKLALRFRPDRILIGEVRGSEAFALLDCMNSGHGGTLATLHASGAAHALQKLESLASRAEDRPTLLWPMVVESVQLVAQFKRRSDGAAGLLTELARVRGYRDGLYQVDRIP